jgi:hypothetical protein
MNALNAFLQFLLLLAVLCYFAGFIAPAGYKLRFFMYATKLIVTAFLIAIIVVEVRVHPVAAMLCLIALCLAACGVLELRRRFLAHAHDRPALPFMSLRTTGKTPVEIGEEHPFAAEREGEEEM